MTSPFSTGNSTTDPFASDAHFNRLYPAEIRQLADRHWTPLHIASKAALFLATAKGVRILDIGSGAGKFCLAAAHYQPQARYFGIDQRKSLVRHAEAARQLLGMEQVSFLHGNFTSLNLRQYDNFYFYNSFYENLAGLISPDEEINYSPALYDYYNNYLYRQLEQTAPGTRLATFHTPEEKVPPCFYVVGEDAEGLLKYWTRE